MKEATATVIFAAVLKTDFLMGKTEQHTKLLMNVVTSVTTHTVHFLAWKQESYTQNRIEKVRTIPRVAYN